MTKALCCWCDALAVAAFFYDGEHYKNADPACATHARMYAHTYDNRINL